MKNSNLYAAALVGAALINIGIISEANAERLFARGSQGAGGAYASQGQYGARAGVRAFGQNAGFSARAGSYAGPNGGSLQANGASGYKRGVGAFRGQSFSGTGPSGGSGAGYSNNLYNAQTGTGTRNSGMNYTNPSGQQYGYDGTTNYARGQGATTSIDTQNKGDYTVDWQKGAKPVVTPVTPQ